MNNLTNILICCHLGLRIREGDIYCLLKHWLGKPGRICPPLFINPLFSQDLKTVLLDLLCFYFVYDIDANGIVMWSWQRFMDAGRSHWENSASYTHTPIHTSLEQQPLCRLTSRGTNPEIFIGFKLHIDYIK